MKKNSIFSFSFLLSILFHFLRLHQPLSSSTAERVINRLKFQLITTALPETFFHGNTLTVRAWTNKNESISKMILIYQQKSVQLRSFLKVISFFIMSDPNLMTIYKYALETRIVTCSKSIKTFKCMMSILVSINEQMHSN